MSRLGKNLKINIKNTQIAKALKLDNLKEKLEKKASDAKTSKDAKKEPAGDKRKKGPEPLPPVVEEADQQPQRVIRARSKSAFAIEESDSYEEGSYTEEEDFELESSTEQHELSEETGTGSEDIESQEAVQPSESVEESIETPSKEISEAPVPSVEENLEPQKNKDENIEPVSIQKMEETPAMKETASVDAVSEKPTSKSPEPVKPQTPVHHGKQKPFDKSPSHGRPSQERYADKQPGQKSFQQDRPAHQEKKHYPPVNKHKVAHPVRPVFREPPVLAEKSKIKLGPTGRHVRDLIPVKPKPLPRQEKNFASPSQQTSNALEALEQEQARKEKGVARDPKLAKDEPRYKAADETTESSVKSKDYRDVKPKRKVTTSFDSRDKQGLRTPSEEEGWRKRRPVKRGKHFQEEIVIVRPTSLSIRTPITIKDLASDMKLKASQLIAKLFMQGVIVTLNDFLEDETTIQLLGEEFGCHITIDTTEKERIRVTDKTIREELTLCAPEKTQYRPPVVTFMGHVDHGKTSLIDSIRRSNIAAGEAGAITQHIGAFRCKTDVGDLTILDTPGHEAFSAMRARGADLTDIVVLVIAGDEGMRTQTIEAIEHAKAAKVTIVVALNKCDRPNFDSEKCYRQLAEHGLLPEAWGGQTIVVHCSATTREGVPQLLDMLALQAEVMELKADPTMRARGSVVESQMQRGLGNVATVLVQNGTLRKGDALVFSKHWGKVKTMRDDLGREVETAGPSTPIELTGLSGLPEAGEEFIVVSSEKEAKDIAEVRLEENRKILQIKKPISIESLMQEASGVQVKTLNVIIRADVQGSVEALKNSLMKIKSSKVELNIISSSVGQISESDVTLAAASKAVILGFGIDVESHAESLIKETGVQVRLHDIIYHAIDDIKTMMAAQLDKIAKEEERGKLEVRAVFKASQFGKIAGCIVTEGTIHRSHKIRVIRDGQQVWVGSISSLKRVKEDVREVQKGLECGVLFEGFQNVEVGDILQTFEITYITQEL